MDETPKTDVGLIARVKDPADGEAWSEFVTIYRPVVVRLALKRTKPQIFHGCRQMCRQRFKQRLLS